MRTAKTTKPRKPVKRPPKAVKRAQGRSGVAKAPWTKAPAVRPFDRDESGTEFAEAVKKLLRLETLSAGLNEEDLEFHVRNNTADQGVDARLKRIPAARFHLPITRPTVFQFKRSLPRPDAIFSELRNPRNQFLREQLSQGDDYVLAVGADVENPVAVEQALTKEVQRTIPSWTGEARLWAASTLRDLFKRSAATIRLFAETPKDVGSWLEWERDARFAINQFKWSPDAPRVELEKTFRAEVAKRNAWRVIGNPGVGKSRFVLELTRPHQESVLVARSFSSDLVHILTDLRLGWLVVDECTDEQHEWLAGMIQGSLRLITIGRDTHPQADPGNRLRLEPIENDAAELLLRGARLPRETRDEIVRRAGGYPKLIRLYSDAISSQGGSVLRHRDLLVALEKFIEQRTNLEAVELWALPTNATLNEVKRLAANLHPESTGLTVGRARLWLEEQGLLGTVGTGGDALHYVTPLLFAEWLAARAWKADPDAILNALASASEAMSHNCFRRLFDGGADLQRQLAQLDLSRVSSLLSSEDTARVAERLARLDSQAAFALVRGLLHPGGSAEGNRAAEHALTSLAWFPETFAQATELLLGVVPPTRNTSLTALFGTFLGLTRANAAERVSVLRAMALSHPEHAVECASEVLTIEGGRITSGLPGSINEAWRPATRDEEATYARSAVGVLVELLGTEQVGEAARVACEHSLRPLFRRGLGELARPIVERFTQLRLPLTSLAMVLRTVERHDLTQLGQRRAAHEALITELQSLIVPSSLDERVIRHVEDGRWETTNATNAPDEAQQLAAELIISPDLETIIGRLLSSHGGPGYFEFGRLCGTRDSSLRIEPILLRLGPRARNTQFAVGYFSEWDRDLFDERMSTWSHRQELSNFVFRVVQRLPATESRARTLLRMLDAGVLPRERVGELYFGGWVGQLEDETARQVMAKALPGARLLLADQWAGDASSRTTYVRDAWHDVSAKELFADTMVDYVWSVRAEQASFEKNRFATSLLSRMSEAGEELECSHFLPIVVQHWLDEEPDALTLVLDRIKTDPRAAWPLKSGQVHIHSSRESIERATQWARNNRSHARTVAVLSDGLDGLATALLEAFPADDGVAVDLRSAAFSGSWVGSDADYWTSKAVRMEAMAAETPSGPVAARLRQWAASARERARIGGEAEAAFAASAIELPIAGSR